MLRLKLRRVRELAPRVVEGEPLSRQQVLLSYPSTQLLA